MERAALGHPPSLPLFPGDSAWQASASFLTAEPAGVRACGATRSLSAYSVTNSISEHSVLPWFCCLLNK